MVGIKDELIISYYLFKNCKLWVWDFDDTLIDTKTYLMKDMSPAAIHRRTNEELDKEVPTWRYFKKIVEHLVMNGRYVGIASFGTREIIKAYLDRIMGFNQKYFTYKNIIAPCYSDKQLAGFRQPPDKNEYVYDLMKLYRVEDFKLVVLFDDNAGNISQATAIGIVAIQIDTPRTVGENQEGHYFGPWTMTEFDKKVENKCGDEIYKNITFRGTLPRTIEPFLGPAFDKIDFGTGVREEFSPVAFGTGIGSRKVTGRPEYRWNTNNVKDAPIWDQGIYKMPSTPKRLCYSCNMGELGKDEQEKMQAFSLDGKSLNSFESYQKVNKLDEDVDKIIEENVELINSGAGSSSCTQTNNYNKSKSNNNIEEGFTSYNNRNNNSNNNSNNKSKNKIKNSEKVCTSCKEIKMDWIVLMLIVIMFIMAFILFRI